MTRQREMRPARRVLRVLQAREVERVRAPLVAAEPLGRPVVPRAPVVPRVQRALPPLARVVPAATSLTQARMPQTLPTLHNLEAAL